MPRADTPPSPSSASRPLPAALSEKPEQQHLGKTENDQQQEPPTSERVSTRPQCPDCGHRQHTGRCEALTWYDEALSGGGRATGTREWHCYIAAKLCPNCGGNPADGYGMCDACYDLTIVAPQSPSTNGEA